MAYFKRVGYMILPVLVLLSSRVLWPLDCTYQKRGSGADSITAILKKATLMNEAFKIKAKSSSDSVLSESRLELEKFYENDLNSVFQRVISEIDKNEDQCLVAEFLKLAVSFDNSADESLPITFAKIFYASPEAVEKGFQSFQQGERAILARKLDWGWRSLILSLGEKDNRIGRLSNRESRLTRGSSRK